MNVEEIKVNVKRFFSNPNTVTFFLVIGLIVVVYFIYNAIVQSAISPVTLPYSTSLIKERTQITREMISTIQVSGTFVTSSGEGLIQNSMQIIDSYVAKGYQIPAMSFFYKDALNNEDISQDTEFDNLPDGYTIFQLEVDFHSTYGCSIMNGNYIDIFFKATSDSAATDTGKKIIFDKFIESIQVLKVVDNEGFDVFTYTDDDDEPEPKFLYFAVPLEVYELLYTATLIPSNDIELIPVPRNAGYSETPKETSIANPAIEDFINSKKAAYNLY